MKFQPLNYLMKSAATPRPPDMSPSELVSNRLEQLRSALHSGEVDAISVAVHGVQVLKTSAMLACQKIHRAAPGALANIDTQLESISEYVTLIQAYQNTKPLTGVLQDANEYVQQQVAFMAQHQALGCICDRYAPLIEQLSLGLRERHDQSIEAQASYENS